MGEANGLGVGTVPESATDGSASPLGNHPRGESANQCRAEVPEPEGALRPRMTSSATLVNPARRVDPAGRISPVGQAAPRSQARRAGQTKPGQQTRPSSRPKLPGHPARARWLIGCLTLLVLLAAWELVVDLGRVSPRVLAAPSAIAVNLVEAWASGSLGPATALTAAEGFIGFLAAVLLGIGLGLLLHLSRLLTAALYPLLAIAQTLPLITIAPLFVIWFGFEPVGKVVLVALFATFPIAVQTYRGLGAVPAFYAQVALTCGAGRAWTLFHVELRIAAHSVADGMRIAAAYVFATAATAEFLGARNGLGIVLQSAFNNFQTPLIFAATLVIVIMTGLLLGLLSLGERALLGGPETARSLATGDDF